MGTKRLNKNGHFTEIVLHIQVLDRMFYGAEPVLALQSIVFVMEIRWIIVFKVSDQWQNIGLCLLWLDVTKVG